MESGFKVCIHCGGTNTSKGPKYCSQECCILANQNKQVSFPHLCERCGEPFKGWKDARFCSNYCRINKRRRLTPEGVIEKQCPLCEEWKLLIPEYWHRSKSQDDGFYGHCRLCSLKRTSEYKKTERGKKLNRINQTKHIETTRQYRKKIAPITNERERIKAQTDISFALKRRIRILMYHSLRRNKGGKKWQEIVGYSVEDLRRHLEKQFTEGMTWDKFMAGGIHIDHKIPIAAHNFTSINDPDFKKCWALKNLQPLWAFDNISKGAKIDCSFQPSFAIGM